MLFNGLASTNHPDNLKPQFFMALGLVGVIVSLIVSVVDNAAHQARLGDTSAPAGSRTRRRVSAARCVAPSCSSTRSSAART